MHALLLAGFLLGVGNDAPIVPDGRALEERGRYLSSRSFEDTLEYYRRVFRTTGGVRWRHVVNLPGIKAEHLQSLRRNTTWEGINIYEHQGKVYLYVLPREKKARKS